MSTEQEIEAILDTVPTYEEFLESAKDLSGESPRYLRVPNPTLVRFAEAVVLEHSDPKSQVWNLKEELGSDIAASVTMDVIMNAKMMRLTEAQVMTMMAH
jgi:hypothetical protein